MIVSPNQQITILSSSSCSLAGIGKPQLAMLESTKPVCDANLQQYCVTPLQNMLTFDKNIISTSPLSKLRISSDGKVTKVERMGEAAHGSTMSTQQ